MEFIPVMVCNGYFCQFALNQGMKLEVVATVSHFSGFQNAKTSSIKVWNMVKVMLTLHRTNILEKTTYSVINADWTLKLSKFFCFENLTENEMRSRYVKTKFSFILMNSFC